jgi:SAM-dependent methyltransferase
VPSGGGGTVSYDPAIPMATAPTTAGAPGMAPPAAADRVGPEYADLAAFFDRFAPDEARWRRRNRTYYRLVAQVMRFLVPRNKRVLEVGSGGGDLLAAVEPDYGVGIDVSAGMTELARARHPGLRFETAAGERLDLGETFDYVLLSDLVPFAHDLLALFERIAAHAHPGTRVVVHSYSRVWRPILHLAEVLRLRPRKPVRNWVSPEDVVNLLRLAGFDAVSLSRRILLPKYVPLLSTFLNGFVASLWPLNHLCLSYWIVARPEPTPHEPTGVTVVCPVRNEAGNVPELVRRVPELGTATEILFVEGGSTDDTAAAIERVIADHPERDISFLTQPGRGKGDAVRTGFAAAKHDILMILDGDLSVRPEDLPKFCAALLDGRAELVNGSRLVYDIEPGAMRALNVVGNRIFSLLFKAITGQFVKDTLCGTKVLLRRNYDEIAAGRSYFGDFDPFGDFDLLFGAARLNLKIVDMPVRYQPRAYGETNISRWRHGWLLLRMTFFAFWKFRVELVRRRSR